MKSLEQVIAELTRLYEAAASCLRGDICAYAADGTVPPPERRRDGSYCYPELRLHYRGTYRPGDAIHAFGNLVQHGTRPGLPLPGALRHLAVRVGQTLAR
jgi:AMP nucleosidase